MPIRIHIPAGSESYDSEKNEFVTVDKDISFVLEHSLISIQKWEQKWHIPFLNNSRPKTAEQMRDYVCCMSVSREIDPRYVPMIPASEMKRVEAYIADPMTATTIKRRPGKKGPNEIKTAEVLYSDMIMLGIPFECRKWHLNSLVMLIRVCSEKQAPPQKMNRKETGNYYSELNKARKKAWHTKG